MGYEDQTARDKVQSVRNLLIRYEKMNNGWMHGGFAGWLYGGFKGKNLDRLRMMIKILGDALNEMETDSRDQAK